MENKYDAYDMLSLSYTVCPPRKCNKKTTFTDISSNQLFFVINAGHSDLTHAARGEVVGVGGDEGHFWGIKQTSFPARILFKLISHLFFAS